MRSFALFLLFAALPGPVLASDKPDEAALSKVLSGQVAGPGSSCIELGTVRDSTVVEHTAIVYHTNGTRVWVQRPSHGAEDLGKDRIVVSRTSGSRLCESDTVDLVDRYTHAFEGFAVLGEFVPYDTPEHRRRNGQ